MQPVLNLTSRASALELWVIRKGTAGHSVSLVFRSIFFSRDTPAAYGGSQERGRIGVTAADLHHSHSLSGSEPRLRPIPQLMAMPGPRPTERGQGSNLHPHGS